MADRRLERFGRVPAGWTLQISLGNLYLILFLILNYILWGFFCFTVHLHCFELQFLS